MAKNLIITILLACLFSSCTNDKATNSDAVLPTSTKLRQLNTNVILTDSAKLIKHLDSLLPPKFPINTVTLQPRSLIINLSEFKNKKLFDLHLKLRERSIGGSIIDREDMPSTFDLTNNIYQANWVLIARKPRFFAILLDETLVTLAYDLKMIDAIHIIANDPAGNNHFHGMLNTTIYSDLKLKLNYYYEVQIDEEMHYEHKIEDDHWFIDPLGHFKFTKTTIVKELSL